MEIDHPAEHRQRELLELWKQVFGDCDGFWEAFFQTAFAPERCLCILEAGQVAAALAWFDCQWDGDWAYVFAVATRPDFRGRGLCRALMEQTHRHLAARGYQGALLVPAEPELRQMYGKMGYREASALGTFSCQAGTEKAELRTLGPEDYARERSAWLRRYGVLQEGPALALLEQTGVRFYAGRGCLLAAVPGENASVLEFLGDRELAPGILAALGSSRGTFRTPGAGQSFAMGIPLQEGAVLPGYFAFAFD